MSRACAIAVRRSSWQSRSWRCASGLKLVKFLVGAAACSPLPRSVPCWWGCIVAFVVSIMAIRFLMDYVKKHTFTIFGWYRIALGILVLGIWALQSFVLA